MKADENTLNLHWKKLKKNGELSSKDFLIQQHLDLVKYVVSRVKVYLPADTPNSEYDDLISCGVIGLMDAIDKFDISRGIKFKTYAISRIRGTIIDELRSLDWAPRSVRQKVRQLEAVYAEIENETFSPASDEEVSRRMNISVGDLHSLINKVSQSSILSLDVICDVKESGKPVTVGEIVEDAHSINPSDQLEDYEQKSILRTAVENLPERERLVIALYYYEGLTLKQIGGVMHISESRVSQMHTKAVMRLRAKIAKNKEIIVA